MTKLECSVKNCMHNSDNYCCKSAILVDGNEAVKPNETCCASFDENKGGAFTNLFKTPETRLEVELSLIHIWLEDAKGRGEAAGLPAADHPVGRRGGRFLQAFTPGQGAFRPVFSDGEGIERDGQTAV